MEKVIVVEKQKLDVENAVVESAWCYFCVACAAGANSPALAAVSTCSDGFGGGE